MKDENIVVQNRNLPLFFKPILWSYVFEKCDPQKMKKTIITQALSYGSFKHWDWIRSFYGDEEIKNVLASIPATTIRLKTQNLIEVIFNFNNWNHAPRSTSR